MSDVLEEKIERLEKQLYKNAGTIGKLLEGLSLCWDSSFNDNPTADKMRALTQEYGYCLRCRDYCIGDCQEE